jgi:hypothetical protein
MPETTENYHRIRVKDPDLFVDSSFRTIDISKDQGIHAIVGKLKSDSDGPTHVQAYLFDVDKWTMEESKKWVSEHKKRSGLEQRSCSDPKLRMNFDSGHPVLQGYAVAYNQLSTNPLPEEPGIRERILPGAFKRSVEDENEDVLFLWQHDTKYVLGRKRSGQLKLKEDDYGVWFENTPPDVGWAKDLRESIKRRDIANMSFGFAIPFGKESYTKEGQDVVRNVREGKLFEISICTFPVYESTSVMARAAQALIIDGIVIEDVKFQSEEEAALVVRQQEESFKTSEERFKSLRDQWI